MAGTKDIGQVKDMKQSSPGCGASQPSLRLGSEKGVEQSELPAWSQNYQVEAGRMMTRDGPAFLLSV